MLTAGALSALPGIRHGFFTRAGGVSGGPFASLNCGFGSGDDPEKVAENRRRALDRAGLPPASLVTAYQLHSPHAVAVETVWPREAAPRADAMATDRPGIALGVLTADCAPVLLADAAAGVIGAAHAGWRGALDGVLAAAVAAMTRLGAQPARIAAAVGPCIAQASYEVGPEFPAPFLAADPANAAFFRPAPRDGRFLFDLPGYVAAALGRLGIGAVARLEADTCREEERFFSYRRACLRGERDYGRGLSVIALAE